MKRCPACGRTFTNNTLINCLNDGTALVEDVPAPPPYLGAPLAAPPSAETPSFAETPDNPAAKTYTNTPLSAIPELQSPEMQAALKEALDKAGMAGLLDAGSAHSTISIKTSVTTGRSGTPSPGYAQAPPYSAAAAPRRRRSPWGRLLFPLLLAVFFGFQGLRVLWHQLDPGVPAGSTAAAKKH